MKDFLRTRSLNSRPMISNTFDMDLCVYIVFQAVFHRETATFRAFFRSPVLSVIPRSIATKNLTGQSLSLQSAVHGPDEDVVHRGDDFAERTQLDGLVHRRDDPTDLVVVLHMQFQRPVKRFFGRALQYLAAVRERLPQGAFLAPVGNLEYMSVMAE